MITKIKFLGGSLFLILAFILLPNISKADSGTDFLIPYVKIYGIVKDSITNEPIPEAKISVKPTWDLSDDESATPNSKYDETTDENGEYILYFTFKIPESTDVIAKAEGYKESKVIDIETPLHSEIPVNFVLEKQEDKINPVILIPGIMGSYLNEADDGKEVWPNLDKMFLPGEDSFFYKLAMLPNGYFDPTLELKPTNIFRNIAGKDFFEGLIKELEDAGYKEGKNLFVFPYDWRLDINLTSTNSAISNIATLEEKIKDVKDLTKAQKVDIIAHSMGGLLVKKYLKEFGEDSVDKFIDIATPHFGAPKALKALMFGDDMGFKFLIFGLNKNTAKNITQNMPAVYQLLPSREYFDKNDKNYQSYISDIFDMDNNGITGALDYDQSLEFMKNTGRNNIILNKIDEFHNSIDNYSFSNSINIIGCSKPSIGRIYILNKEKSGGNEYVLRYISGDGTVPLHSAEGYNSPKIYVNSEAHAYIPSANGVKQLIAHLLENDIDKFSFSNFNNLSLSKDNNFCVFTGKQISFHSPIELHIYDEQGNHTGPTANGNLENNIIGVEYDILDDNKFAFLPQGQNYIIKGKATDAGFFNMRIQKIENSEYAKTAYFNEIPLNSINTKVQVKLNNEIQDYKQINLQIDEDGDDVFENIITPSSVLKKEQVDDFEKPQTAIKIINEKNNDYCIGNAIIELTAKDDENGSGILKTEYSLDNGKTWNIYNSLIVFNIPTTSKEIVYNLKYSSTDKAGNRENEKEEIIKIKQITIQLTILNIENLYNAKEIKRKFVKNSLIKRLNQINKIVKKYNQRIKQNKKRSEKRLKICEKQKYQEKCEKRAQNNFNRTNNYLTKIYQKIIDFKFKNLLKILNFYHQKNRISDNGYDIIKKDINNLKKQDLIIY